MAQAENERALIKPADGMNVVTEMDLGASLWAALARCYTGRWLVRKGRYGINCALAWIAPAAGRELLPGEHLSPPAAKLGGVAPFRNPV
jgi:hypothetical protein